MQKEIDFYAYKRSLAQLDLFDVRLNEIKSKQFEAVKAIESSRKDVQHAGIVRLLKSKKYGS